MQPVGPDSEIALCTGSCTCESGDTSKGFTTYGFVKDGVQRCFTVFHPLERAGESLPVVISSQCYGKDKLQRLIDSSTWDSFPFDIGRDYLLCRYFLGMLLVNKSLL